jgi:predicted amidohydrolase
VAGDDTVSSRDNELPTRSPGNPLTLSLLQVDSPSSEPRSERLERVVELVTAEAAEHNPDVIVLPELWPTGFFHFDRYRIDAEPLDGPTVTRLAELATSTGTWLFGGSFIEQGRNDRLHNTSVCLSPAGELKGHYRKIHLFGFESDEARTLTPGDEVRVFDTPFGRVAMTTCYDLRFPELYRQLIDQDVEVIVVSSAWPEKRRDHWELLNRARAVENLAWIVACNARGVQGDTQLAGSSLVVSPWGEVTGPADPDQVWLRAAIDPGEAQRRRATFPALEDRRLSIGGGGGEGET